MVSAVSRKDSPARLSYLGCRIAPPLLDGWRQIADHAEQMDRSSPRRSERQSPRPATRAPRAEQLKLWVMPRLSRCSAAFGIVSGRVDRSGTVTTSGGVGGRSRRQLPLNRCATARTGDCRGNAVVQSR